MKLEDIAHKKKSVSALIRYIKNTTQKTDQSQPITPNYSLLLGAGASVSSGIDSGQTLTEEWKKEVWKEWENENKDSSVHFDTPEEYFKSGEKPNWFDSSNAYSSLFENRYDLQRQRRMFVERQVSEKTPSIGYAYLVKLIENGYFNTIFTTNFDDLLNESFYRFSTTRPIVCAHDSSISGITVTSSRPKIIKLHGDYLFENIKTTLKETDSLENNMRMKFQEYAKDFGLIVVGYSGQDHSIMDILKYLVQQEEYFKNGIFWCVRKQDKEHISTELSKLLWLDRVYFVEIDGFDEFFAELNHELNNGHLPINDDFLSRNHQKNIIDDLIKNKYVVNSPSEFLKKDCKQLLLQFEQSTTSDFLSFLKEKQTNDRPDKNRKTRTRAKSPLKEKTREEGRKIQDIINEAFALGNANKALMKLEDLDILNLPDNQYKLELLELKVDLSEKLSDKEIQTYFDELIRLNPKNEGYYDIASNRLSSRLLAIDYVKKAADKFKNDFYIHNKLAKLYLQFCQELPNSDKKDEFLTMGINEANKSLELNKSVSNDARCFLADFYDIKYANDLDTLNQSINDLYKKSSELNPHHPNTLYLLRKSNPKKYNADTFINAIEYYETSDNANTLETIYSKYLSWLSENESDENNVLNVINHFEESYDPSEDFLEAKAQWLLNHEYFKDSLIVLKSLNSSFTRDKKIIEILSCTAPREEVEEFYEKSKFAQELTEDYFEAIKEYEKLCQFYDSHFTDEEFMTLERVIRYSYACLKCDDYPKAENILKPYYDNPALAIGPIIVNYLYARKQQKKDVANQIRTKIIDNNLNNFSEYEMLGAYCVLGDETNALTTLRKIIKRSPINKYCIEEWPVMKEFIKKDNFQNALKHTPRILNESKRDA